jgi:hypothetical protein
VRNRSARHGSTFRRLAQRLTLGALAIGMLPAAAAVADDGTARTTKPTQARTAAIWTPFVSISPASPSQLPKGELLLFGPLIVTPDLANFDPSRIPGSVTQAAQPTIVVPDDGKAHTYKAVFHVLTDTNSTTTYQLNGQTPVTAAGGTTDIEFIETIPQKGWHNWTLRNASGNHWFFYRCDFYELTG